MPIEVTCPSCNRKMRFPDQVGGRQAICPYCSDSVAVPAPNDSLEDVLIRRPAGSSAADESTEPAPLSSRLGFASLLLGLVAIMVLCIPYVGYASIGLSSIGLVLGLGGLVRSWTEGARGIGSAFGGAAQAQTLFGVHALNLPLAGIVACVLALILALLPFAFR